MHKEEDNYLKLERKRKCIMLLKKVVGNNIAGIKYADGRLLSADQGNEWIREKILTGQPFSASRFGMTEMNPVIMRERGFGTIEGRLEADKHICIDSGFFPCEEKAIDKYKEVFLDSIKSIDLMGIWFFINNEEYIIDKYMNKPVCALPRCLEPFYFEMPWTASLEGKKVLIIHPFVETIISQYKKREKLFENKNILPEFDLKTVKAVQTLANQTDPRFKDWFDALEWMKSQIDKVDFDVALLGCGAYGIPLQDFIKKKGKQSIYVGGGLQLLFGIRGKRWDAHPVLSKLYNPDWARPNELEKISDYKSVEIGGPYW